MKTHDIAFCKQFIQFHFIDSRRQSKLGLGTIHTHFHTECLGDASCSLADVTKTDNPHFLAFQFHQRSIPIAEVHILGPTALLVFIRIIVHPLGNVQQMGKYHLSHRRSAISRDICHHNPMRLGSIEIHYIISGSQHTDVLQAWQSLHVLSCNQRLVGNQYFGIRCTFHQFRRRSTVVYHQFSQCLKTAP